MIPYRKGTSFVIKKKGRGGKRHLRRLQHDSKTPGWLWLPGLQKWHYQYEKLGLAPWHWHHRQPPRIVRQLAVQHLLTTFFAWQPELAALNEPVYSAVWLVESEFAHSSQVAVGIRECVENYQNRHGDPIEDAPSLPTEYQQLPGADRLSWTTHSWQVLHEDCDYPNGWPHYLLRLPHYDYYWQGRTFLVVQTGWVWVGQLREQGTSAQPETVP
jgi:hypothetical protein